jgi:putative Mg2+ transporter-C (MgtC) family protein
MIEQFLVFGEQFIERETILFIGRLLLAGALGMLIGSEREYRGKDAGSRTYTLVAIGSALFTILSANVGLEYSATGAVFDPTRIAAQIVVGIGFIGAGLIIFRDKRIEGLTTAAGLWVTAAMGAAVGFGFYEIGIATAIIVLLVLWGVRFIDEHISRISPYDD